MLTAAAAWFGAVALALCGPFAAVTPSPSGSPAVTVALFTLGGVAIGESVLDAARAYGPPDLVQTLDDGHEWRWYDVRGIDRDLLTDDGLKVHRILLARPGTPRKGQAAPLVQPQEMPLLDFPAGVGEKSAPAFGAQPLAQPDPSVLVWRVRDAIVVGELQDDRIAKLLALDAASAQRLGYVSGPRLTESAHRPPILVDLKATGYPRSAVEARAQGVVVLRVAVDSEGKVSDVKVLLSSGRRDIDDAESASMRESTFRPARCGDHACAGVYLDREEYEIDS
ncbi:MAG: TonB family protein [Candidatus Eremiobacteraeota bacterium]|nr:TonB family protein [Candidatus Eremiobacteraeota bacterium]MBC5826271.1 TonB family protein [Candidatus Eremiobacteraeota bacterium]